LLADKSVHQQSSRYRVPVLLYFLGSGLRHGQVSSQSSKCGFMHEFFAEVADESTQQSKRIFRELSDPITFHTICNEISVVLKGDHAVVLAGFLAPFYILSVDGFLVLGVGCGGGV